MTTGQPEKSELGSKPQDSSAVSGVPAGGSTPPIFKVDYFPPKLTGMNAATLRITFRPDVAEATIEFKCSNDALVITFDGLQGPVFEFDFTQGASRTKTLELRARQIEKEAQELVTILGQDSRGNEKRQETHWVRLEPGVGLKDIDVVGPSLNLIWRGVKPWSIRLLLLLFFFLGLAYHYQWGPPEPRLALSKALEPLEIYLHFKEPYPYLFNWDGLAFVGERESISTAWECRGTCQPAPSIDKGTSRKILLLESPVFAVGKLDRNVYDWFDFVAHIQFRVRSAQRSASWVMRARNKEEYYLCRLTFPSNGQNARVDGYVCAGDCKEGQSGRRMGVDVASPLPFSKFEVGDTVQVEIIAKGGAFLHRFKWDSPSQSNSEALVKVKFFDPSNMYDHGAFGFQMNRDSGDLEVDNIYLDATTDAFTREYKALDVPQGAL